MPTLDMEFEAWSRQRTLDDRFATARSQGVTAYMVTWEPWAPVPAALGREAQYAVQPAYSNAAIAAGAWDAYIRSFARSVRDSGLTVYVRYAHEMNGNWYPWSHDMTAFRSAWRHVVDLFRAEGATNARFVWSINPNLYQDQATVIAHAWHYWPGSAYVDVVGATMIDFGGVKDYPVARFVDRFRAMHSAFGKRLFITEFQTDYDGRLAWLDGPPSLAGHRDLLDRGADALAGLCESWASADGPDGGEPGVECSHRPGGGDHRARHRRET